MRSSQLLASANVTSPILVQVSPPHRIDITQPGAVPRLLLSLSHGRRDLCSRAEQLPHLRARLGGAEKVALHLGAAQRAKDFLLLQRLDAFRGGRRDEGGD